MMKPGRAVEAEAGEDWPQKGQSDIGKRFERYDWCLFGARSGMRCRLVHEVGLTFH